MNRGKVGHEDYGQIDHPNLGGDWDVRHLQFRRWLLALTFSLHSNVSSFSKCVTVVKNIEEKMTRFAQNKNTDKNIKCHERTEKNLDVDEYFKFAREMAKVEAANLNFCLLSKQRTSLFVESPSSPPQFLTATHLKLQASSNLCSPKASKLRKSRLQSPRLPARLILWFYVLNTREGQPKMLVTHLS